MDTLPTMLTIEPYEDPPPRQTGNVPAFLMKLWKLVEDPDLDPIISWNENGETFKVHDQIGFSRDVLPKYYKHNNFSSFVRQVNMYGFRKIVDPTSGSLKPDNNQWEFFHQHFQKGKPHLMSMIKRKATTKDHETKAAANQVTALFSEVERLKNDHDSVSSKLDNVKKENELLWKEVGDLREQHKGQQVVINKLIQVFVKILMTNKKDIPRGVKRRALDYPAIDTKVARPSTQEVLPYGSSTQIYNHILPAETVYTVDSPSPNRLTEILDDNITVLNEGMISSNVNNTASFTFDAVDSAVTQPEPVATASAAATTTAFTKEPFVVKNNEKTITIIPGGTKTVPKAKKPQQTSTLINNTQQAKEDTNVANTGFVFPDKYKESQSTIDTSQLNFSVSNDSCTEGNGSNTINTVASGREPTNFLLTPENIEPSTVANSLVPKNLEPMTTPVVNVPSHNEGQPGYARQNSFRDRKEISDNVEKINRSIEIIQDMLDNQPVNIDLKTLTYTTDILPEQVSVQELSQLILSSPQASTSGNNDIYHSGEGGFIENGDDLNENGADFNENGGQLLPYVEPVSPSQYMDPHFTSNSDFLNNVLDGDDNSNGDMLVE